MKAVLLIAAAVARLCTPVPMLHAGDGLPPFSWERMPVYAHVGKTSGTFTPEQLDFLARRFNLITIETHPTSTKHCSAKDGFVAATRGPDERKRIVLDDVEEFTER